MKKITIIKKKLADAYLNDSFVFNLGRLWQEVISEHWDDCIYLYEFIQEVTLSPIKKRYSKELKNLRIAINEKSRENINKVLEKILKW
ncbi:MAG: hypothetical protein AB1393_10975 [Candidatus Edwardsbacteria bacterium]